MTDNDKVPPILSRSALLALVQYIHSNSDRSIAVAANGLGESSSPKSSVINEHLGRYGAELSQNSHVTAEGE